MLAWVLTLIVLILTLRSAGPVADPESHPILIPPAADCRVTPQTVEEYRERLVQAGVPPHGEYQPGNRRVFRAPDGSALSDTDAAAVVDTVWQSTACLNAAGWFGSAQFFTDRYLREQESSLDEYDEWVEYADLGMPTPTPATDEFGPIGTQELLSEVCDGVLLPDGRIGVWVLTGSVTFVRGRPFNDTREVDYWYLVRGDQGMLVDDVEIVGFLDEDEVEYVWTECYDLPPHSAPAQDST